MGVSCVPLATFGERDADPVAAEANTAEATRQACQFLWNKQSADGAWRSETYGLLKSGQSLTPFVLIALSEVPAEVATAPDGAIEKAMAYLRRMSSKDGFHGRADPDLFDYPNYATAYALRCFLRYGKNDDRNRIQAMTSYLVNQQFAETTGFKPDSVAYGGWGFGVNRRPTLASFVDLSHTRRVLAALAEASAVSPSTGAKAERFLSLLQKSPREKRSPIIPVTHLKKKGFAPPPYDGGFFSSPNVSYANKGRIAKDPRTGQPYYQSYATATCDGILSLLASGVSEKDSRVIDAARWLDRHPDWALPAGIPAKHPEPWCESMIYYHLAARAEAYAKLDWPGNWRQDLTNLFAKTQRPDGSFINLEGGLMKEDDPILCSTLAVTALGHALVSAN